METAPVSEREPSKGERFVFAGVLAIGVLTFLFGILHIRNTIVGPFRLERSANTDAADTQNTQLLGALSQKDTDSDGVSDYDELYLYSTSPYLADSDSDGKNDGVEVQGKSDPNCPEGQTCSALSLATPGTNSTNASGASSTGDTNLDADIAAVGDAINAAEQSGDEALVSGTLSVDELRTTLRNAGAPAATIDALGDEELLALYQQVVKEESAAAGSASTAPDATNAAATNAANLSATNATESSTTVAIDSATLQNLSAEQIREFLRQGGAEESALQGVDDETLKAIFSEALQSVPASDSAQ